MRMSQAPQLQISLRWQFGLVSMFFADIILRCSGLRVGLGVYPNKCLILLYMELFSVFRPQFFKIP